MNENITQNNFPHQSESGVYEAKLYHFDRNISSEDAISWMKKDGWSPADAAAGAAFGEKFPEKQREFPIVCLGQTWRRALDNRRVVVLLRFGSERRLNLHWFGRDWNNSYRFLAVRHS